MGRLERNIERKLRRRNIIFSLLILLLLFVLAIGVTNSVMVQMTGISPEQNILSSYNINVYVKRIREFGTDTQWFADIQMMVEEWIDRIR